MKMYVIKENSKLTITWCHIVCLCLCTRPN